VAQRNQQAFYTFVNRKLHNRNVNSDFGTENGTEINDVSDKAEVSNSFFSSIYTKENVQNA
jgi:hypothetical protein